MYVCICVYKSIYVCMSYACACACACLCDCVRAWVCIHSFNLRLRHSEGLHVMSLHLFSVGKKFRRVSAGNFFGLFLSNAEGFREDFQGWFPYLRSIRFQGKCSVSWFGVWNSRLPNTSSKMGGFQTLHHWVWNPPSKMLGCLRPWWLLDN